MIYEEKKKHGHGSLQVVDTIDISLMSGVFSRILLCTTKKIIVWIKNIIHVVNVRSFEAVCNSFLKI
jgi:hypothetical protein